MENQCLCTLDDLAKYFRRYGLTKVWLRREALAGRIPSFQVGRRLLFDAGTVEETLICRAKSNTAVQKVKEVDHA